MEDKKTFENRIEECISSQELRLRLSAEKTTGVDFIGLTGDEIRLKLKEYVENQFSILFRYSEWNRYVYSVGLSEEEVLEELIQFLMIQSFAPDGNIHESGIEMNDTQHMIMRILLTEKLKQAFSLMKVDLENENVKSDPDTKNIGTPGRIAKMWCGANMNDTTELLSGRWNPPPRMASFNTNDDDEEPIFIKTQIRGVCSHHLIGFHDIPMNDDSYAIVGYIPKDGVKGGISKISRFVNFASRRMWLQESLTSYIGKKIEEQFKTDSVYVALVNISHGCSWTRGANDTDATTTTFYKSGRFKTNPELIPQKYKG